MKRDRSDEEDVPQRVQAKNNTAAIKGYDAYFGTYSIDETAGTLATHLEGSISPINIGKTYVREVRVVNNELIIQLKTTAVDGNSYNANKYFLPYWLDSQCAPPVSNIRWVVSKDAPIVRPRMQNAKTGER